MGSPLASAMTDIFMNWLIDKAQAQSNCFFTVFHYADDLFLSFDHHQDLDKIFEVSNFIYNNIAFTKELQENNTIPFLDTLIYWNKKNINISVYITKKH